MFSFFTLIKIDIPRAPALGLLLENVSKQTCKVGSHMGWNYCIGSECGFHSRVGLYSEVDYDIHVRFTNSPW